MGLVSQLSKWPLNLKFFLSIARQLIFSDIGQKINLLFGGGKRNFITQNEGGKRIDENLIDAWKRLKQANGESFDVLYNTDDLESWLHTDYALGEWMTYHG